MESALNLNQRLQTVKSSFLPDNNIFFILDHSMKSVQGKKRFSSETSILLFLL